MSTWSSLRLFLNRRQIFDLSCDFATGGDQIRYEPVVNVEDTLVFSPIPHIVALRQDSPDFRPKAKGVRQHLKNDVPLRWAKSAVPQRRQAECVSGAVGEIEPAVERVGFVLRVLQAR